jgi:hypothetical protein
MPFIIPARNPKTPEGIDDHGHLEIDLVSISGEMSFEELWGRYASGCLEYAFSRDLNACPHICDQSYASWMENMQRYLEGDMVQGPFYLNPLSSDNHSYPQIVFLDRKDAARFADTFPDWNVNEECDAFKENLEILRQRIAQGDVPTSPRMVAFCVAQGLLTNAPAAPAPTP